MPFDARLIETRLDDIRHLFVEGMNACKRLSHGNSLGHVASRASAQDSAPHAYINGFRDQTSRHAALAAHDWGVRVLTAFLEIDAELRRIPALRHHDIHWQIDLQRPGSARSGLPPYRIRIMDARLTSGYRKSSRTATASLHSIAGHLGDTPEASPVRRFEIEETIWPAASPEAAARIWAALHAPDLLLATGKTAATLPEIREIHDRLALERGLRAKDLEST